jgi:hypothetical protein
VQLTAAVGKSGIDGETSRWVIGRPSIRVTKRIRPMALDLQSKSANGAAMGTIYQPESHATLASASPPP